MDRARKCEQILVIGAGVLFVAMFYQVARRVLFPWDYYIWSESPFLTDMMKLSSGHSVFGSPADANSFVYSPGLDYLAYALLGMWGLAVDIRAARIVVLAMGSGAAILAAGATHRFLITLDPLRGRSRRFAVFAFFATALVLFKSPTFDIVHPDNALLCHAAGTFLLLCWALDRGDVRSACVVAGFASFGVLFKQTAVLAPLGVLAALLVANARRWGVVRSVVPVLVAMAVSFVAALPLFANSNARFFTIDLLAAHDLELYRVKNLVLHVLLVPHRALLFTLAVPSLIGLALREEHSPRRYLLAWLALGVEVLPSLAAYLKAEGNANNLTPLDFWMLLVVLPSTWHLLRTELADRTSPPPWGIAATSALILLVVSSFPSKLRPTTGQWAFGQAIEAHLLADAHAGRRVLLPHGTAALARAGFTEAPLDRANTVLEMNVGKMGSLAGTRQRIEARYYDRIYMFLAWYGTDVLGAIERNYHEVEVIPGDGLPPNEDEYFIGYQGFMHQPVRVMDVNAP